MQETKLADDDAPVMPFQMRATSCSTTARGAGTAWPSRHGPIDAIDRHQLGDGPVRNSRPGAGRVEEEDFNPFDEARMVSADVRRIRLVCLYAPNGRVVGSPFYDGKLAWYDRLLKWLDERCAADDRLVLGDYNVTPADDDVWDAGKASTAARMSRPPERRPSGAARWGWSTPTDRNGRARGHFTVVGLPRRHVPQERGHAHRPPATPRPGRPRESWSEIDREARKGLPVPSDHAPVLLDLDERARRSTPAGRAPCPDRHPDAAERQAEPGPGPLRGGARGEEQGRHLSAPSGPRPQPTITTRGHPALEAVRRLPDEQHPVLLADHLDLVAAVEAGRSRASEGRRGRPRRGRTGRRSSSLDANPGATVEARGAPRRSVSATAAGRRPRRRQRTARRPRRGAAARPGRC